MFRLPLWVSLAALVLTASCGKSPEPANRASAQTLINTNQRTFQVKGQIVSVKPGDKHVQIKHETIANYMPGMTMSFDVKDANELDGLQPGDLVSFRLIVADTEGWIDQIRRLSPASAQTNAPGSNQPATLKPGEGPGGIVSANGGIRVIRDVEPLNVGDVLPEYHFTNQFGAAVSTSQFKGQALAISFLFTRCPFPTACPYTANNFAETQKKLAARSGGPTNWHLLTISFDPEFDTPTVLKTYAEAYHYDPKRWTFATGALIDITAIAQQFGLAFLRDDTGSISHNLRTIVIDAAGRVQKGFPGNTWTSDELAEEMVKAAGRMR